MQSSGPELIDFGKESPETLAMYGAEPGKARLREQLSISPAVSRAWRAVRAALSPDWDHHDDITKPFGSSGARGRLSRRPR